MSSAAPTTSGGVQLASVPALPAIVVGEVRHHRRRPVSHDVRMRTHQWLVDLAEPAELLARRGFRGIDHFAGDAPSIETGLRRFAAAQGEQIGATDRLVMLATPRSLGHVFNPLSVHWCLTPSGRVRFAVLEIHNTYRQRHAHLVRPDAQGRAEVDKAFYVSPFFEVAGRYRVRLTLRDERVSVAIVLEQAGGPVFMASFRGVPEPATRGARIRAAVRTPFVAHQTSLRIRWHGIRLWRRLPVVPRPPHRPPAGLTPEPDKEAR
ncbi:MAG TPA: DUF1365 domain-containing protein [Dermatophilaceae bacterium]|nr:DUF1365 domain-containing protein [Dermatophilaceae bacterium]